MEDVLNQVSFGTINTISSPKDKKWVFRMVAVHLLAGKDLSSIFADASEVLINLDRLDDNKSASRIKIAAVFVALAKAVKDSNPDSRLDTILEKGGIVLDDVETMIAAVPLSSVSNPSVGVAVFSSIADVAAGN